MSPLISERPQGGDRKCLDSMALRLFYVPFVDPTDARKATVRRSGHPTEARKDAGRARAVGGTEEAPAQMSGMQAR